MLASSISLSLLSLSVMHDNLRDKSKQIKLQCFPDLVWKCQIISSSVTATHMTQYSSTAKWRVGLRMGIQSKPDIEAAYLQWTSTQRLMFVQLRASCFRLASTHRLISSVWAHGVEWVWGETTLPDRKEREECLGNIIDNNHFFKPVSKPSEHMEHPSNMLQNSQNMLATV